MAAWKKSKGGGGASAPAVTALLIIDMINDRDFAHLDQLAKHFKQIAPVIENLRDQADAAGVPMIEHCLACGYRPTLSPAATPSIATGCPAS